MVINLSEKVGLQSKTKEKVIDLEKAGVLQHQKKKSTNKENVIQAEIRISMEAEQISDFKKEVFNLSYPPRCAPSSKQATFVKLSKYSLRWRTDRYR